MLKELKIMCKHNILWNKISELLDKTELTKAEVARRANISTSLLPAIRNGKVKKPSFELICKLSDAFNVDINYFREES